MAVMQRKDGRWCVYYKVDGKKKWEYFGRGPEGEEKARQRDKALGFGEKADPDAVLFSDVARAYVKAKTSGGMNDNSLRMLKIRLEANILPTLGNLVATSITYDDLDRYVDTRKNSVRVRGTDEKGRPKKRVGVKLSTINRELTDIKAILNFGVKRRPPMIAFNPVRDYQKPGDADLEIIDPPTVDEADKIMAAASEHLRRAIRLSWFLGLRPGAVELMPLTWTDVNWKAGHVRVESARKGSADRRRARIRRVPVIKEFLDEMRTWWEADEKKDDLAIIRYHGKPVKNIHRAWWGALDRAGIKRRIRLYDIRHAFVTRAIESGVDIKALAEVVGSNPATLMKFYQHVTTARHRAAVESIPFWSPSGPESDKN